MSITVRDCLKLPSLREGRVVAGKKGLDHIVNNISVLEITDADKLFGMHGPINNFEICLTSFSGISEDTGAQRRMIEYISEIGDVCIIIYYVGIIVKRLSQEVIDTADRLDFPLIIMPEGRLDFRYSEAIRDVSDLLFRDMTYNHNIHKDLSLSLSKVPERSRTLSNLLKIVSDTVKSTLLLSDASCLHTIQSSWPVSNSIKQKTLVNLWESCCENEEGMAETEYLGHNAHVFRLRLDSHIFRHYWLYILDESGNLSMSEAEQISDIIQLISEAWGIDDSEITSYSLIDAIIDDDRQKVRALARKYYIKLEDMNTLILIHADYSDDKQGDISGQRTEIQTGIKSAAEKEERCIFFNAYNDYMVLFMKYNDAEEFEEESIYALKPILGDMRYSISIIPAGIDDAKDIFLLYEKNYVIAEKILRKKEILTLSDLMFCDLCVKLMENTGYEKAVADAAIEKLRNLPDAEEIINTLETYYLDTDCQISLTSQALYVHRNTVKYRLNKANAVMHFDGNSSKDMQFMHILMGYYRLKEEKLR